MFLIIATATPQIVTDPFKDILQALDLIEDPDAFKPIDLTTLPDQPLELKRAAEAYNRQEFDKALVLFSEAAKEDRIYSHYYLGKMYYLGYGVPVDYRISRKHYDIASKNNNPKAMYNLGIMSRYGKGGEKDIKKQFHCINPRQSRKILWLTYIFTAIQ